MHIPFQAIGLPILHHVSFFAKPFPRKALGHARRPCVSEVRLTVAHTDKEPFRDVLAGRTPIDLSSWCHWWEMIEVGPSHEEAVRAPAKPLGIESIKYLSERAPSPSPFPRIRRRQRCGEKPRVGPLDLAPSPLCPASPSLDLDESGRNVGIDVQLIKIRWVIAGPIGRTGRDVIDEGPSVPMSDFI